MSVGLVKCSHILQIVRLRRWRHKAASSKRLIDDDDVPPDVPAGHVAVSVGRAACRYIIRATHLNHPVFKRLLVRAEEEYGFSNREGRSPSRTAMSFSSKTSSAFSQIPIPTVSSAGMVRAGN